MDKNMWATVLLAGALVALFSPGTLFSQVNNAVVDGLVTDPQGAVVIGAKAVLMSHETAVSRTFVTDKSGYYTFPAVVPGAYQMRVTAPGFADFLQDGIEVRAGFPVRLDVKLTVTSAVEKVEVKGEAPALNFENAEVRQGLDTKVIQDVPLEVSGGLRAAANFATILPGVTRGVGEVWAASINGGQAQNGNLVVDGESMYTPNGVPGLTDAASEFPLSPDSLSEFQIAGSNYDAQYSGGAGVVVEHTKSGTDRYHGTAYEYNRNSGFNATQWGLAKNKKPLDVENDFGGSIGGRFKLPFVGSKVRTYFYGSFEGFRLAGGVQTQTLSLPSAKEQAGDFSDWVDTSTGNLIPVYDPATTTPNPNYNPKGPDTRPYLRNQFMGCNGNQPNVICSTDPRLQNSLAKQWFQYLPQLSNTASLSNYIAAPAPLANKANDIMEKIDVYIGEKDHFSEMFYYFWNPQAYYTQLPVPISNSGTQYVHDPAFRINYEHTFNEHLVNHLGFGYQDNGYYGGGIDGNSANKLPQIPGVASHAYPSQISFDSGFNSFGTDAGSPAIQPWVGPNYVINDVVYLTKGKHTLDFGADLHFAEEYWRPASGQAGNFNFHSPETGLLGTACQSCEALSGNPIASFLLEQVDSANVNYYAAPTIDSLLRGYAVFVSDTWHATPKLSINAGLRYQVNPPYKDANNHFSYFDPNLSNPGAGGRLGALAFAGSGPGRSGVSYPEAIWWKGVSPRLGFSYAVTPSTVVRGGYGLYDDFTVPIDFTGGIAQDGWNTYANWGSSLGGLDAAFLLSSGPPQNYPIPPQITPNFDNGSNVGIYRPRNGNRSPYSQQYNLTVEHQFTPSTYISAAYVGSKGTHLLSGFNPLNALNPKYLSLGPKLYDTFQPGGPTTVDGVNEPFPNFATIMTGCSASVAQALVPYPQYCNGLTGANETLGSSTYNSFQLKAEHRFSTGLWALFNYTNEKLLSTAPTPGSGGGWINPYQLTGRIRSLAPWDVPQSVNFYYIYQLPFGSGRHWLNHGGIANGVVGGWVVTGGYHFQTGIPFQITSSTCNIPSQLRATCLPGLLPGVNPFLQDPNHFDPGTAANPKPLLNVAAFEPAGSFSNFYTGYGRVTQNIRQPNYSDFDFGLKKVISIGERVTFELRGDAFNLLNAHHFNAVHGGTTFYTDIASPSFGEWNGSVTPPRNMQVSGRVSF